MRPPHFRQRVTSSAKTRARSFAQAMRRGLGEELGEDSAGSLGRANSSASCGGGGGAACLGMTCSRRRWWLAKGYVVVAVGDQRRGQVGVVTIGELVDDGLGESITGSSGDVALAEVAGLFHGIGTLPAASVHGRPSKRRVVSEEFSRRGPPESPL